MTPKADFNRIGGEEYGERFVSKQNLFYRTIAGVVFDAPKNAVVLDVGCGPGCIADFVALEFGRDEPLTIFGVEPSNLVHDAVEVANKLKGYNLNLAGDIITFVPKRGSIEDSQRLFDLKENSLDGIVLCRSAHEIALSRGYETFREDMRNLVRFLRVGGTVVVGDPTYRLDVIENRTGLYNEEVRLAREITENEIGHSHGIDELISPSKMIELLRYAGCESVEFLVSEPVEQLVPRLREKRYCFIHGEERATKEMYVLEMKKTKNAA